MPQAAERHTDHADHRIALLGAGMMGEALLAGWIRSGHAPRRIFAADRSDARLQHVSETYGVQVGGPLDAVADADTVLLAVKPQQMAELLTQVAPRLRPGALVVSIAAGITTAYLQDKLPAGTPVVRAMPNTPALVGEGMTALSAGTAADPGHLDRAQDLLRACGRVVVVPETALDAVTGISGSGPAYVFYVVEAMIEAGVLLGLPRDTSSELVVQTLYGAATMLARTGDHPTMLRERVSSPGGTTVAALRVLDEHAVRAAFVAAAEAAARRSVELASGQG